MSGHIEYSIQGFFISDGGGLTCCPSIALRSEKDDEAAEWIAKVASAMRGKADIRNLVSRCMQGDPQAAAYDRDDWRPMTEQEIGEYKSGMRS